MESEGKHINVIKDESDSLAKELPREVSKAEGEDKIEDNSYNVLSRDDIKNGHANEDIHMGVCMDGEPCIQCGMCSIT